MKIKLGDIVRSKHDMIITIDLGDCEDEEKVEKGQYFVVIDYGEYEDEDKETRVGWTLLSQKHMTKSRWEKTHCILEESFIKE